MTPHRTHWLTWLFAALVLIPTILGFGNKFLDLWLVMQGDEEGAFAHAATYAGHPVAAAVALRMIEIIEERDLLSHVRGIVPHLQRHIHGFAGHPMVFNTRAIGLGGAVQFRSLPDAPGVLGQAMQAAMMDEGLLLRVVQDTINFAPPLIITAAETDEMFARFTRALATVEQAHGV